MPRNGYVTKYKHEYVKAWKSDNPKHYRLVLITFFIRQKVIRKRDSSSQNLTKITRLNFQNVVSSLAKKRYFVVIAFKMLKVEFKSKYTILLMKV